jgi:transcriptional regulator with XRE-family HTH domain
LSSFLREEIVGTVPEAEEPFVLRVRRLAAERGMSLERVGVEAWDQNIRGTSPNLFKQVIAGRRALKPALIEAVARALHVPPEEFPEYRLALARRALDENEVGLDEALELLSRIEGALRERAAGKAGRAAARERDSQRRSQAGRSAGKSRPGG